MPADSGPIIPEKSDPEKLIEKAIALAVEAHAGQVDKAGEAYILHPLHLMMQMESDEERICAVLHDVIEDSCHTLSELRELGFPPSVIGALSLLTHDSSHADYEEYIQAIKTNPIARRVKLADLTHNMDPRRLPYPLSTQDWERLQKYRSAWRILTN